MDDDIDNTETDNTETQDSDAPDIDTPPRRLGFTPAQKEWISGVVRRRVRETRERMARASSRNTEPQPEPAPQTAPTPLPEQTAIDKLALAVAKLGELQARQLAANTPPPPPDPRSLPALLALRPADIKAMGIGELTQRIRTATQPSKKGSK